MDQFKDLEYYRARLLTSRAMMRRVQDVVIKDVHSEFALHYGRLVAQLEGSIPVPCPDSGGPSQTAVQVVLVKTGDLNQPDGI